MDHIHTYTHTNTVNTHVHIHAQTDRQACKHTHMHVRTHVNKAFSCSLYKQLHYRYLVVAGLMVCDMAWLDIQGNQINKHAA